MVEALAMLTTLPGLEVTASPHRDGVVASLLLTPY